MDRVISGSGFSRPRRKTLSLLSWRRGCRKVGAIPAPQEPELGRRILADSRIPMDPPYPGAHLCSFLGSGRMACRVFFHPEFRGNVGPGTVARSGHCATSSFPGTGARLSTPFYSLPSLFALRYAATFGFLAVLSMAKSSGARRTAVLIVCAALLILGWVARIALGAHWPSDVIISYYVGLLWAAFLIRFVPAT